MGIVIASLAALALLTEMGLYFILSRQDLDDVSW